MLSIGIDIGGTKILASLVKEGKMVGECLSYKTEKTSADILSSVLEAVEILSRDKKPTCVGISTAGAVDSQGTQVISSTGNLPEDYRNIDFKKIIEKKFNLKTYISNDANAAAYAEYKFGAAAGHENTITITLGTGIGGGIIINGKLLRGKSGAAGEVGHILIDWKGKRRCTCGTFDCWESYASGTGYRLTAIEMAKEEPAFETSILSYKNPDELTTYDILDGVKQNDEFCKQVHERWERHLLTGLIGYANIFDPESIVLSGGMAGFVNIKKLEETINKEIVTTPIKLLFAKAGNNAGLIGAALLAEESIKA